MGGGGGGAEKFSMLALAKRGDVYFEFLEDEWIQKGEWILLGGAWGFSESNFQLLIKKYKRSYKYKL